jgi:hypothetical protein
VLIRPYDFTRVQVESLRRAAPTARPPPCSSLHCFESARWQHLKRGLEQFPRGPLLRADPQGRCAAALLFEDQLLVMKAKAVGSSRPPSLLNLSALSRSLLALLLESHACPTQLRVREEESGSVVSAQGNNLHTVWSRHRFRR